MSDLYHWQDESGAWHVGTRAVTTMLGFTMPDRRMGKVGGNLVAFDLIKHCHTGKLEWVPEWKLKPYPAEEIPTP